MTKFLNAEGVAHLWSKILEKIGEIALDPVEVVALSNEDIDAIIAGNYNPGGNNNGGGDLVG